MIAERILTAVLKKQTEPLTDVRFDAENPNGEGLLLFKRKVGTGEYVYAMYTSSPGDFGISRDFRQIGIIANNMFYFMEDGTIPYEVRKALLELPQVVSFAKEYADAASLEAEIKALKEYRETMSDEIVRTGAFDSNIEPFTRSAFFRGYPNQPVFYTLQRYLSERDFAGSLCGVQDVSDAIRKTAHKSGKEPTLVFLAREAEKLLKSKDFIKDWEISMLDALIKCREEGETAVSVSFPDFTNGGQTPYYQTTIEHVIVCLENKLWLKNSDFGWDVYQPLVKSYGHLGMPDCSGIVSIMCNNKEIYQKPEREKECESHEECER